jgi:hypothetical protein
VADSYETLVTTSHSTWCHTPVDHTVVCTAVAMQRPQDRWINNSSVNMYSSSWEFQHLYFYVKWNLSCRIWGFHSREYEEFYLLGYNSVYSAESQLMFRRHMTHLSSGLKNKPSKKPAWKQVASRALLAIWFHARFLLGLIFDPEDGADMCLRNVSCLSKDYMELCLIKPFYLYDYQA